MHIYFLGVALSYLSIVTVFLLEWVSAKGEQNKDAPDDTPAP